MDEFADLEEPEEQRHGDIAYKIYNKTGSETIVMCHGCGGHMKTFSIPSSCLAGKLMSRYRVITFDWYGHGNWAKSGV